MSTKSKIALVATLATLVAAPAFAGDQNLATELQDSCRYVPQANLQVRGFVPTGAYASANSNDLRDAQIWHSTNAVQDFQLQGR